MSPKSQKSHHIFCKHSLKILQDILKKIYRTFWKPFFLKMTQKALASFEPKGNPVATPIWVWYSPSEMKNDLYAAKVRSCISSSLSKIWTLAVAKNKSLNMLAIVYSKGILVNRLSTCRPTIKFLELNLETSLANENELWTVLIFR